MEEVVEVKECSICDDKYTTEGGDLMNTSNHSKKKLFQVFDLLVGTKNNLETTELCGTCTNSLHEHDEFLIKMQKSTPRPIDQYRRKERICPHCGETLNLYLGGFSMHVKFCEIKSRPGPYRCDVDNCTLEFDVYKSMRIHRNYHAQIFRGNIKEVKKIPCEVCGRMVRRGPCMKLHLASHGISETCYCPLCTKHYSTMPALHFHFKTKHAAYCRTEKSVLSGFNMKVFMCLICNREKFKKISTFSEHMKNVHPENFQNESMNCEEY